MSLKVVLLTRSGRPSGALMAWRLLRAGFEPIVLVESRGKMVAGNRNGGLFSLLQLGLPFMFGRVLETLKIRKQYFLRKLFKKRFKEEIYLSIEELALDHQFPVHNVEDHNGDETANLLNKILPDVGVLTNTRKIRKNILDIPKYGFLNLHLSELPKYAGLDSIFWALYHGEEKIGATVHLAAEKIDRGEIIRQGLITVSLEDDENSLYSKALWLGTHLMSDSLCELRDHGRLPSRIQNTANASYFSWPTPVQRKAFKKRLENARCEVLNKKREDSKPRVVHVITRMMRGGAQENTLASCLGLREKGYSVVLVTGPSWTEEGEILSEALEKGLEVILIPELVREISLTKDLKALWKLTRVFRRNEFDLIHTHTSKGGLIGRLAAKLAGQSNVVHTPHGHIFHSYFSPLKEKLFLCLEIRAASWCKCLIALTPREKEEHLALRVGNIEQWTVIPSGVSETEFSNVDPNSSLRAGLGISSKRKIVGFVGRLAPVKGPRYLVEAIPSILKGFPEAVFLFVGDGEERSYLEKRSVELGITSSVIFVGQKDSVAEYLALMDAVVVPSLNEGMGRVIVEAGLSEKPVVASSVGGILDLISSEETGLLVEPRDPAGIAKAVLRLLADPCGAQKMAARLREFVADHYTETRMIDALDKQYQEVLSSGGGLLPLACTSSRS